MVKKEKGRCIACRRTRLRSDGVAGVPIELETKARLANDTQGEGAEVVKEVDLTRPAVASLICRCPRPPTTHHNTNH